MNTSTTCGRSVFRRRYGYVRELFLLSMPCGKAGLTAMRPIHPPRQIYAPLGGSGRLSIHADNRCRPISRDGSREYRSQAAGTEWVKHLVGKVGMFLHRFPFLCRQAAALFRIPSGTPILPISCSSAPQRTCTSSASFMPKSRARFTVISTTLWVCPSVSRSRRSSARDSLLSSHHRPG